jgi:hypothetical protein
MSMGVLPVKNPPASSATALNHNEEFELSPNLRGMICSFKTTLAEGLKK